MSDGAATCKQNKAKVSSLLGRRAHENWRFNAQSDEGSSRIWGEIHLERKWV